MEFSAVQGFMQLLAGDGIQDGVEAPVAEVLDYRSRDFSCVFVLPEDAVRRAFAG